jgi:hypothetical protein
MADNIRFNDYKNDTICLQVNEFIRKIYGQPKYDGRATKERKQRLRRAGNQGQHQVERVIVNSCEGEFNYKLLVGDWKDLVDWLFDVDFHPEKSHQGVKVDDVIINLTNGSLPQGMSIEKLIDWIKALQKETAAS